MRWTEIDQIHCSVAKSLSILGESWTLLIIRCCFLNHKRFEDFQKELGVTRHLLAARLKNLVRQNILEKKCYQTKPSRYEYYLTEKGRALFPVILALMSWGDEWLYEDDTPPLQLMHTRCRETTTPKMVCEKCDSVLNERNTLGMGVALASGS